MEEHNKLCKQSSSCEALSAAPVAFSFHTLSADKLVAEIAHLFGKNSLPGMDCKLFSPPHPSPDSKNQQCNPQLLSHYSLILGQHSCRRTPCILVISWETLPFGVNIMLLLMGLKFISSFPITYFSRFMNAKWHCREEGCWLAWKLSLLQFAFKQAKLINELKVVLVYREMPACWSWWVPTPSGL